MSRFQVLIHEKERGLVKKTEDIRAGIFIGLSFTSGVYINLCDVYVGNPIYSIPEEGVKIRVFTEDVPLDKAKIERLVDIVLAAFTDKDKNILVNVREKILDNS